MRTTGTVDVVYRNEEGREGRLDLLLEEDGIYRGTLTFENGSFHDFTFQARFSYGLNPTLVSAPQYFRLAVAPERVRALRFEDTTPPSLSIRASGSFSVPVFCHTTDGRRYPVPPAMVSFDIDDPAVAAAVRTVQPGAFRLEESFGDSTKTTFRARFEEHEASLELHVNERPPSRPSSPWIFLRRRPSTETDAFGMKASPRRVETGDSVVFEAALHPNETKQWSRVVLTVIAFDFPGADRETRLMKRLLTDSELAAMRRDEDRKYRAEFPLRAGGKYGFQAAVLGLGDASLDILASSETVWVEAWNNPEKIAAIRIVDNRSKEEAVPLLLSVLRQKTSHWALGLSVEMQMPSRENWIPLRDPGLIWSVEDTDIAAVDGETLTGKTSGRTVLRVSFGKLSASRNLYVGDYAREYLGQPAHRLFSSKGLSIFYPLTLRLSASADRAKPGDTVRFVAEPEQPVDRDKLSTQLFSLKGYLNGLQECTVWMRLSDDGTFRGSLTFIDGDDGLFLFSPNPLTQLEESVDTTAFRSNSLWIRVSPDGSAPPPSEEPQWVGTGQKRILRDSATLFTISASSDEKPPVRQPGPP